ncbi:hypothetical protein L798_06037 [Zootermopsis nevadensis]|uniref:Uncharacterized protein n=1 Tax=Zootermopsis nevadensis TaxID=136037 RepID=A0A067RIR9_ZOONE|nr:hypothetical protein L798_06037 [Zootermopsis nevadensis]
MMGLLLSNELERMRKEAVVTCFKIHAWYLPGETEKHAKMCPRRNLQTNTVPAQQQHQLRTHTHGPTTQLDATVDFLRIIGSCNSSRTFRGTGLSQELASSLDAAYVTRLWGFSACTWYRQTYIS